MTYKSSNLYTDKKMILIILFLISESYGIREIKTIQNFREAMGSDKLIVIDFYAIWCGPCMRLFPKMEVLSNKYSDVNFYKINYDNVALKEICKILKIESLPTICFFKDGKYLSRLEGADENIIETMIFKYNK